jgi:hypothetical protein
MNAMPRAADSQAVLAVVGCGCFLAGFSWLAQAHTHSSYAASARTAAGGSSPAAALAAGYDLVFLIAAGISLAIAVVSVLLPQARAAARREPTAPTTTLGTAARESGTGPGTAR